MMLMRWSFHVHVVAADVMVIPLSCSWAIQSIVAAPSCTSPICAHRNLSQTLLGPVCAGCGLKAAPQIPYRHHGMAQTRLPSLRIVIPLKILPKTQHSGQPLKSTFPAYLQATACHRSTWQAFTL